MTIVETRNVALDGIKFFLICLVVIGHAIEPTRYTNPVSGWLYSAIYIFHMPLFIMLSGYFTKSVSSMERLNRQALKLLESYFLISIFIYLLVSRHYSVFIAPALSSWYILSLISWRYGYQLSSSIIDKCLPRNLAYGGRICILICFSIVISFMAFMLPLNGISKSLAIGRTCQFLPYFTWGILVQHYGLDLVRTQKIKKFSVLIVIVVLLSISFMHPRLLHIVTFHREDIQAICTQTGASICMVWFYKLYVEIAALMFCLFMLSFSNLFQVIGEYGKSTMTLFVLQALTIHFLVRRLPHNIYVELCVAAVVIFAGMCLSMKGYGSYIINPFSTLFKLKNKQV